MSSAKFWVRYRVPGINLHTGAPLPGYSRSESVPARSLEEAHEIRDNLKKFHVDVKVIMTTTKEVG